MCGATSSYILCNNTNKMQRARIIRSVSTLSPLDVHDHSYAHVPPQKKNAQKHSINDHLRPKPQNMCRRRTSPTTRRSSQTVIHPVSLDLGFMRRAKYARAATTLVIADHSLAYKHLESLGSVLSSSRKLPSRGSKTWATPECDFFRKKGSHSEYSSRERSSQQHTSGH